MTVVAEGEAHPAIVCTCGADVVRRGADLVCSVDCGDEGLVGAFAPRKPITGVAFLNFGNGRGDSCGPCTVVDLAALSGDGEPTGDGMVPDDA